MKPFAILRHGVSMVGRTIKSYALLSVTIVLSFSLLLGYLLYTDSSLYNEYKDLFRQNRGIVRIQESAGNTELAAAFLSQAAKIGNTQYDISYKGLGGKLLNEFEATQDGQVIQNAALDNWQLYYLPDQAWVQAAPFDLGRGIQWLGGNRENFYLEADECLVNETFYRALGMDRQEAPAYTFRFDYTGSLTLRIAGYIQDQQELRFDPENGSYGLNYNNQLILSTKALEAFSLHDPAVSWQFITLHSDSPEQVVQLAKQMNFTSWSVYELQNEALEAIRYEKRNKAIIACALLLLLGINLYSSFTNALNDRKFEIGVKRAVGASSFSIVRQFLYESLLVMAVNTLLSIAIVTDIFVVYKYIYERIPNEWGQFSDWILYISPHSIAMFGLCAVTLTVVFSLVFAYKTTRVEIVQYLKAE